MQPVVRFRIASPPPTGQSAIALIDLTGDIDTWFTRAGVKPVPISAVLLRALGGVDHAVIARKLIAHFKEDVRARAYLRAFAYDEATALHLATKAGLPKDEMMQRLQGLQRVESASRLTEAELLRLSNELHNLRQRFH